MKILNFGSCNIDYVYSMDHIVKSGETEMTSGLEIFAGGKGLNQSIAISRAGAEVYHAGCIGNDGGMLMDILNDSGVDTSYIKRVDVKNGHAVIQVGKNGENSIFLHPGSNSMITKEIVSETLSDFGCGDILLLQNEINNIEYIIKEAYAKGMRVILNPSPLDEGIFRVDFSMLSYLILNEIEARAITGFSESDRILDYFKETYPELKIMLTLGSAGCIYSDGDLRLNHPAFRVDAVDTTAAGDTFTGYFIAGIARGDDFPEIIKKASAAAAISVSRNGAAPSIPHIKEVEDSLPYFTVIGSDRKGDRLRCQIDGYIKNNLKSASLESLANILGYSTAYTGNIVKKVTGNSFSELLQSARCVTAADLLKNTDMSVSEIIHTVGYENESFFRKIFKEKYGKNPLKYKNSI